MIPTKKQMLDLLRPKFGDDVELVCDKPVILGEQSMVPFGVLGVLVVFQDETGKKFAVQVPMGVGLSEEKAA
jgi:hypothetical protein